MSFSGYLVAAMPPTLLALAVLLLLVRFVVRPDRGMTRDPLSARLSLRVMAALHRNVRVERRLLTPLLVILAGMLAAWLLVPASSGVGPELICWLGAGTALLLRPMLGERLMRTRVDVEAVLFFLSLFVMVGAVERTDAFRRIAEWIVHLPLPPAAQLVVFLLLSGLLTGVFSAGPSMAALLEVAQKLAAHLPANAVYVGLALSVCAGSSLFLTAATSGPMAQILTERADLRDREGRPVRFGFSEFLPIGLVSFTVIQLVAIGYALLKLV
jgi:Na+/H+ antiporter NhaD/arsenite permease-like protein